MSNIKEAIERKFPRYRVSKSREVGGSMCGQVWLTMWAGESRMFSSTELTVTDCELLVKERNELIDKLIEAAELLAEAQGTLSV